ncbi:MAG: hypothetical protein U9R42_01330, partial [Bacteroidota bacterium]|nr:hypothetical protein [Bacteroidota bacterium]
MDYKQFYIELGRLIYAIAKSDGEVQKEEVSIFKKILNEELLPLEDATDEFGTDSAFYTEFEFENLSERDATVNETFVSFIKFLKSNKKDVTEEIKQVCLNSVIKVADAFAGIEKSEQYFIDKLKKELDEL